MEKFKIGKVDDWGKNQFALKGGAMGHSCSDETGEIKCDKTWLGVGDHTKFTLVCS